MWPDNELAMATSNMPIEYNDVGLSDTVIAELKRFDESIMEKIDWDNPENVAKVTGRVNEYAIELDFWGEGVFDKDTFRILKDAILKRRKLTFTCMLYHYVV